MYQAQITFTLDTVCPWYALIIYIILRINANCMQDIYSQEKVILEWLIYTKEHLFTN